MNTSKIHLRETTDNLVIGSGVAGLSAALQLSEKTKVVLVCKSTIGESNSLYAQGGIASVLCETDSFDNHIQDTMKAGHNLNNPNIVKMVVENGPREIQELIHLGMPFTKDAEQWHLTKEGGHSHRRVIHAHDFTGQELIQTLRQKVLKNPNIQIMENTFAIDFMTTDKFAPHFSHNRCLGAYVYCPKTAKVITIQARHTFLCSGGHGRLYRYTSNPPAATGDGLAMGWRAGCKVANLEFMQFHPTCLYHPKARSFLITEALRGEGAILRNNKGEDFIKKHHPMGSLAPRDIVARAIHQQIAQSQSSHVWLDARKLERDPIEYFPNVFQTCLKLGIDIRKDMIPVVPAAHYSVGGLICDEHSHTRIQGLYAVGEVSCTGLHGANRLASNSLIEALVFARKAVEHSQKKPLDHHPTLPTWENSGKSIPPQKATLDQLWDSIRCLMWNNVGLVRTDCNLQYALSEMTQISQKIDSLYWASDICCSLLEVRNLAQVALLTIRCAIRRKGSLGSHYNEDYGTLDSPIDSVLW
ncbi:MAG: L-aspartate oxidase [Oligoflexales bacterium]